MDNYFDFIVIGSGPSGVQAAQTLVEAGKQVCILDVGITNSNKAKIPEYDFITLRKTDENQFNYLIGENYSTLQFGHIKPGAQVAPDRSYINQSVNELIPVESTTFLPVESLAYGGLGVGWGLGCYAYSKEELDLAGLNYEEIHNAYKVIASRIGISCSNDLFGKKITDGLSAKFLPPLKMDNSLDLLFQNFNKKKEYFNKKHIYLGHPAMAILTNDFNDRKSNPYFDMDFYEDFGYSNYRPWLTIEALKKHFNFKYLNNFLAVKFEEKESHIELEVKNLKFNIIEKFNCNKLIIACGALGSARIVLRSFKEHIQQLPILCNPYYYVPCINIKMLGKQLSQFKTSMAQAMMLFEPDGNKVETVSVAFYSYRSLMLYRLINEVPIGIKESRIFMQFLQDSFVIAGVHFPEYLSEKKYLRLITDLSSPTHDKLSIYYELNKDEIKKIKNYHTIIKQTLRKLNCYPLKTIKAGNGSSIHYAGSIPFLKNAKKYGTTRPDGLLNCTKNVYLADGSGFNYLPAKGITFTLMANAHNVACNILKND